MVRVLIPAPLRPLCGGANALDIVGVTLDEVLSSIDERFPGFYDSIVDSGQVRCELAIGIDGEVVPPALDRRVLLRSEVAIVTALPGG